MHRPIQSVADLYQQRLSELENQLRFAQTESDRQVIRAQLQFYRRCHH